MSPKLLDKLVQPHQQSDKRTGTNRGDKDVHKPGLLTASRNIINLALSNLLETQSFEMWEYRLKVGTQVSGIVAHAAFALDTFLVFGDGVPTYGKCRFNNDYG